MIFRKYLSGKIIHIYRYIGIPVISFYDESITTIMTNNNK